MKKTINTNLGGLVFHIDEDGYLRLEKYLNALKAKFSNIEEQTEILQDIEYRLAEIFTEKIKHNREVINLQWVNEAIAQLGEPDEIEQNDDDVKSSNSKSKTTIKKKLFRNADDKIIGGVISGFCNFIGFEYVTLVRLLFIFLTLASIGFPGVIVYIIMMLIVPEAKTTSEKLQMKGEPTTLENIEEAVKKNLQSANISNAVEPIKSISKILIKIIATTIFLLLGFYLLITTFTILTGGISFSIFSPEIVYLIFPSLLSFNLAALSLWILIAIPLILLLLLLARVYTKRNLHFGLSTVLLGAIWFFGLIGTIVITFTVLTQFKTSSSEEISINFPNPSTNHLIIDVPKSMQDIKFSASKRGVNVQINDFDFLSKEGYLILKSVDLNIKPTTDSIAKLEATYFSYGKNKQDAENNIEFLEHEIVFENDSLIKISPDIFIKNKPTFRIQNGTINLYYPIGKTIQFNGEIKEIAGDITMAEKASKKSLTNNTFRMTEKGLMCISCE